MHLRAASCTLLVVLAVAAARAEGGSPSSPATAVVRAVRITGVTRFEEATLLALMKTIPGKLFDPQILDQDVRSIEAFYHKNGFSLALAGSDCGIDEQGVVTIPIDEGRIEKIIISGAKKTRKYVLLRELDAKPGDVYNGGALAAARQRLYNLGIFHTISIASTAGAGPGKAVVTVDVKERSTGSIMTAMGYTSTSGLVGFLEWSDINLLGTGQTLSVHWQRGVFSTTSATISDGSALPRTRTGFDIGYASSWVLRPGISAGLRAFDNAAQQFYTFNQDLDPENIKSYEWRKGYWLTAARKLASGVTIGILGRAETIDYDVAPAEALPPAGDSPGPAKIAAIRLSAVRGPMNPFTEIQGIPRSGVFVELGRSRTSGDSALYLKYGITAIHYFQLSQRSTIASRAQLGFSSGSVPFPELYAIGGQQTLRSYPWNHFLGTRMMVANIEYRHEIKPGLAVVTFVDLGYAWPRGTRLGVTDLRPAAGLGLRVATPIGPIRIDFACGGDGVRAHVTSGDNF